MSCRTAGLRNCGLKRAGLAVRCCLVAFSLFAGASVPLFSRSMEIQSFHSDLALSVDGTLKIDETIRVRFEGQWNGIYRTLPIEYHRKSLHLSILNITDDGGTSLKYETRRDDGWKEIKIWVPGAQDAERTVRLSYQVENAVQFFEDHEELYWNITGDQWAVPIEEASARVALPPATDNLRAIGFEGPYGAVDHATVSISGHDVEIRSTRALGLHEGLTLVAGWNPCVIRKPGQAGEFFRWLLAAPFVVLPFLTAIFMYRLWRKRGQDPRRLPIVAQYGPPEGLTPSEAGTLVDNRPDVRDITSMIVDLAVRGHIRIEETKKEKWFGLAHDDDYTFHRVKPRTEWSALKSHEREFLEGIFEDKDSVAMSSLTNEFYKKLPKIKDKLFEELIRSGYYVSRPDKVRASYLAGGIAAAVVLTAAFLKLGDWLDSDPVLAFIAGAATGLVIVLFGLIMPARTVSGARTAEHILGFEEFLDRVESDRFARVIKTPEMFEKYLPYALALGCEKRWARAFEDIYREPPSWYVGPATGGFHPTSFVSNVSRMTAYSATAMTSSPRSSSSSGFGGGGFSGGGGGGGGGGGF